jgi:hypothetical protein
MNKFLGVDGQYHPAGSFLGVDGKYHPQGYFLGGAQLKNLEELLAKLSLAKGTKQ